MQHSDKFITYANFKLNTGGKNIATASSMLNQVHDQYVTRFCGEDESNIQQRVYSSGVPYLHDLIKPALAGVLIGTILDGVNNSGKEARFFGLTCGILLAAGSVVIKALEDSNPRHIYIHSTDTHRRHTNITPGWK